MKLSNIFSLFSHVLNFAIILYFVSFLININSINSIDLSISFFGLFASVVANILSVVENKK